MTFTQALTDVLAPLWPVVLALAAMVGATIVTIARREVSKKLFNENGTTKYVTSVDFKQFKDVVAVNLGEFKNEVAKEFAKHKKEVEDMCAQNQSACSNSVCLKIDGVLVKLDTMDKQREEARREAINDLKEHTGQITKLTSCVSNLSGKFEQMEKQLNHKVDK